ncbi:unnamed protein product [Jaminaea pallidilutea]
MTIQASASSGRSLLAKLRHPFEHEDGQDTEQERIGSGDGDLGQEHQQRRSQRFSLPRIPLPSLFGGSGNASGSSASSSRRNSQTEGGDGSARVDDEGDVDGGTEGAILAALAPSVSIRSPEGEHGQEDDFSTQGLQRQRSRSMPSSSSASTIRAPIDQLNTSQPDRLALQRAYLNKTISQLSINTLDESLTGPQELPDVPLSYRVPSPKQAFYDTHMGSSSGWYSIKGRAAGLLRVPLGSGSSNSKAVDASAEDSSGEEQSAVSATSNGPARPSISNRFNFLQGLDAAAMSLLSAIGGLGGSASANPPSLAGPPPADLDLIPKIGPRHPLASTFFDHPDVKGRNVVILGGYRGSILRSAQPPHQMLWIPLKVGATLRRPSLELGLTPEDELNAREKVLPGVTLSKLGRLVDMSHRLKQKYQRKGAKVHMWGYDWRLSLGTSSRELQNFLMKLYQESDQEDSEDGGSEPQEPNTAETTGTSKRPRKRRRKGAIVIAHSMGGMVALHALSQIADPKAFHTLSFASTPFLGTPNILGPLAWGDTTILNDSICSPESSFSFRSSFYLLPRDGRCFEVATASASPSSSAAQGDKGGKSAEEAQQSAVPSKHATVENLDFLDDKTWEWAAFSPVVKATQRWQRGQRAKQGAKPADAGKTNDVVESKWAPDASGSGSGQGASEVNAASKPDANETSDSTRKPPVSDAQMDPSEPEHDAVIWQYLRRTLAEVRQFDEEIKSGFSKEKMERGEYPPLTMLSSGKTPTTRGVTFIQEAADAAGDTGGVDARTSGLEGGKSKVDASGRVSGDSLDPSYWWKQSVSSLDYSKMLFAAGDGVVLLRSAVAVPGGWNQLLVKDDPDEGKDAWITQTAHRHVAIMSDVDGIGRAMWVALRARERKAKKLARGLETKGEVDRRTKDTAH